MKELKLDVVRFESDDIMTTSCGDVYGVAICNPGAVNPTYLDCSYYKNGSNADGSGTTCNSNVASGITLVPYGVYHVDSNGNIIGVCNAANPVQAHNLTVSGE